MRLTDRTVVVTGGASGIGAAMARRFVAEGARVYIGDVNADGAAAVAAELGDAATGLACDVTAEAAVRALVAAAVDGTGRLDVMCNNAGIERVAPTIATDTADWAQTQDVNITGVFYGCKAALERMVPAGGGVILNTASVAGTWGAPGLAAYAASKGGVVQLSRAVALENAPFGVRCNAICPGFIATPMADRTAEAFGDPSLLDRLADGVPMGRLGTAEEIAALAAFLASDAAAYITGQALVIDGGLTLNTVRDARALQPQPA